MKKAISKIHYLALSLAGLLFILSLWSLLTYTLLVPAFFLPSPSAVYHALLELIKTGVLLTDIKASMIRICLGVGLSFLIALPLGLALGLSKKMEALIEPILAFIRYIPASAFIPLAIIWLGIGEFEKILILLLGLSPYLTLIIANLVIQTKIEFINVALTLGATQKQLVTKVILPGLLPHLWDSARITFGTAWTLVIITEIVGAQSGLGQLMVESGRFLRTDAVFSAILVIGILGLMTDYFFKLTYPLLFPWMKKHHA